MIDALYRYATDPRNKLVPEPGFKSKSAKWAIQLSGMGEFQGILPLLNAEKKEQVFPRCPEFNVNYTAHPLLAAAGDVVLLTNKHEDVSGDTQMKKHRFFVARMEEAGEVSPGFRAAAVALSNPDTMGKIRDALRGENAKATDKVTFWVDGTFPIKADDWHEWWRARRVELINKLTAKKSAAGDMVCLVTGEVGQPYRVHPKITGLASVGGQPSGEALVAFDKAAFCSYGLEQSANAAMSESVANAYRDALDDLIKKGESISGMKVAYWFSGEIRAELDPLQFILRDRASTRAQALIEAKKLLTRPRTGDKETAQVAHYKYYVLCLSGASGRVMVRDWVTGSFEELAVAVERWFQDFDIVSIAGSKDPSPTLERVITAGLPAKKRSQDYKDWVKPAGSLRLPLWKAILDPGRAIPDSAVTRVLQLHRAFIVTGELDNAKRETPLSTLQIRMGLLKAWLIRKYKGNLMTESLNPAYTGSAYHCGRLIAMLAALQRAALPNVDAGVIQRYYGAASTTPNHVIGRLIHLAQHHIPKVAADHTRANPKGLAYWYETQIGEIVAAINAAIRHDGPLPATFNTKQQTEFALGYYQQIADNRTKKADKPVDVTSVDPEPSETNADATDTGA